MQSMTTGSSSRTTPTLGALLVFRRLSAPSFILIDMRDYEVVLYCTADPLLIPPRRERVEQRAFSPRGFARVVDGIFTPRHPILTRP